ncbi:hypothetical protein [Aestuariivirga sp.]|uniref:hypothetical protein n=1 Tax=Aestuariivirga sp. TaxID=2650926 RepID=UPI003BAD24FA
MSILIEALTADALSTLMGQPPTSLAALGLSKWWRRKAEEAREILLEELKHGVRLNGDFETDIFYSLVFRYLNAVKQGTARRNLRLLAQMINSGISKNHELSVDEISALADTAASLSREEIALIAALWSSHANHDFPHSEEDGLVMQKATLDELVPNIFASNSEVFATASMLMRTGLVTMPSVWGGNRIDTTEKFYRLMKVCNVESVLEQ